ncbi:MAG TPA: hypothetical protein VIB49_02640 [Thermoplasmata archaeon]|jgi:hypothetical protein
MLATGLNFDEVEKTRRACAGPTSDWLAGCSYQGWTFVTGSATFWDDDLVQLAKRLRVDACSAMAESTTWVLEMQYAKPDGDVRRRSFRLRGEQDVDEMKFTVVMRTAEQGPMRRDDEGEETSEGPPLPGEPQDIVIGDDTRLLKVLSAVGVPLETMQMHYFGDWDWKRMEPIPGPGRGEKAFTLSIEGPLKDPESRPPREGGVLKRLFRK